MTNPKKAPAKKAEIKKSPRKSVKLETKKVKHAVKKVKTLVTSRSRLSHARLKNSIRKKVSAFEELEGRPRQSLAGFLKKVDLKKIGNNKLMISFELLKSGSRFDTFIFSLPNNCNVSGKGIHVYPHYITINKKPIPDYDLASFNLPAGHNIQFSFTIETPYKTTRNRILNRFKWLQYAANFRASNKRTGVQFVGIPLIGDDSYIFNFMRQNNWYGRFKRIAKWYLNKNKKEINARYKCIFGKKTKQCGADKYNYILRDEDHIKAHEEQLKRLYRFIASRGKRQRSASKGKRRR